MIFGNSRPFWHMVFVGLTGVPTFMTTYYYYQLLTQIGLLMVIPLGLFVAGQVFLIVWLQKSRNPALKTIGEAFGAVLQYLALFEGLLLTVMVFYVLGGGETTSGPGGFYADFVIGATYLSMFIYGATGATIMIGTERALPRLAAGLYTFVALVPPFWLVFFKEAAVRSFAASNSGALVAIALAYYALMSVIGMWLMVSDFTGMGGKGEGDADAKPGAKPKGRLPG